MSKRAEAREYILVVRTADPVRLRAVIEAEGWQMPLAPFLAGREDVAVVETLAIVRRRQRRRRGAGGGIRPAPSP